MTIPTADPPHRAPALLLTLLLLGAARTHPLREASPPKRRRR